MQNRAAYGGQAVIEGVMIRGTTRVATACRAKDNTITIRREPVETVAQRHPIWKLPFFRGTPALIDSLRLGYRTLLWSADQAMEGEEVEKPTPLQYTLTIIGALAFGIGLFVLLPTWGLKFLFPHAEQAAHAGGILASLIPTLPALLHNIAEGVLRVIMLVLYVSIIGRSPEIRRVFAYHGAEHKVVNGYEFGAELTVEAVRPYSRIHPRCGTSFLFLFFIVGILLHALIGWPVAWLRVITRLLMIPLVAGVAYELIRLAGRFRDALWLRLLIWPGLLLQRLTTAEPTDDQVEVALASMRAVLEDEGVLPTEPVPETT